MGVEPVALNKAGCQAKRHGSIISPLACTEMEWTSADHIGQRRKTSPWTKFNGSADSIPNGKTKKTTPETVRLIQCVLPGGLTARASAAPRSAAERHRLEAQVGRHG